MSTEHELQNVRSALQRIARELHLIREAMERESPPPPTEPPSAHVS